MQTLNQLWNHIVTFFSELPRSILFLATCAVFLSFIIGSQITHSTKELKYLGEIVKQERLILELEEGFVWQNNMIVEQHQVIQKQVTMIQYYEGIIGDLIKRLNEKLEKERPKRSEATNHEGRTKHKNMG